MNALRDVSAGQVVEDDDGGDVDGAVVGEEFNEAKLDGFCGVAHGVGVAGFRVGQGDVDDGFAGTFGGWFGALLGGGGDEAQALDGDVEALGELGLFGAETATRGEGKGRGGEERERVGAQRIGGACARGMRCALRLWLRCGVGLSRHHDGGRP